MTRVVAFDIDGALDTKEGMTEFRRLQDRTEALGILSARSLDSIEQFAEENSLSPDFMESALVLKGQKLRDVKNQIEADEYVYFGSWFRDRIHSVIAGWEYQQI